MESIKSERLCLKTLVDWSSFQFEKKLSLTMFELEKSNGEATFSIEFLFVSSNCIFL